MNGPDDDGSDDDEEARHAVYAEAQVSYGAYTSSVIY